MKVLPKRKYIFLNENVFISKMFAKRKCLWNESKIVLVFESFFVFFFSKKCQKQKFFRVARMGHHTRARERRECISEA